MPRLDWNAVGERFYEQGVDQGVLYIDGAGYAWPGLVSVSESLTGGEAKPYYIDGYKYANVSGSEEFEATIEAFSSPAEFAPCDGVSLIQNGLMATQQPRKSFGFSYRSKIGNDIDGIEYGYKIHLVYNALANPSNQKYATLGGNNNPETRSWAITTLPPSVTTIRPTAHFIIDSTTADPTTLASVEDMLYGSDTTTALLPTVPALMAMFGTLIYDGGFSSTSDMTSTLDGGTP